MASRAMNGNADSIKKIALINFGGIGDEILFSPVIEDVKRYLPHAHTTLFLEDRSRSVQDLLSGVDAFQALNIQGQSRFKSFFQLWNLLRSQCFDVVISSGSSPFIPVLLFLSGIWIRVGFKTGSVSRRFLTVEAPLAPKNNRRGYAGDMYYALSSSFLQWLLGERYTPMAPVLPHLKPPGAEALQWADKLLENSTTRPRILLHPGVSTISVQKNILKGWPPAYWAELLETLTRSGYAVYLVGGPDDKAVISEIRRLLPADLPHWHDLYGQTKNLSQLAALITVCDLLLCVDSSPLHMAVGYQKPLVAMFGPTDEKKLVPLNDVRFQAIKLDSLSCRPCLWDARNTSCENPVCLNVPVSLMADAVQRALPLNEATH